MTDRDGRKGSGKGPDVWGAAPRTPKAEPRGAAGWDSPEPESFPCAQCGANLVFQPGADRLICPHCGHVNFIETRQGGSLQEVDFRKALSSQIPLAETETTQVVVCANCGAAVERDEKERASVCPYCASPLVGDPGANRHFKPKGILPFVLSEREGRKALDQWLGSRWFAPAGLREFARADKRMTGIYTPYWTFDADTQSDYVGQRGDTYYVTETYTVQTDKGPQRMTRQVPRIRWTNVRGRVRRFFDDILVLASTGLPKAHADALGPWDLHALTPYKSDYLAGFRSEAYTVDLEEGFAEARAVMDLQIRRDVRFDIGGDHQQIQSVNTQLGDITFKHILLPIWIAAYRYRDKSYQFVVNGRTGTVRGDRPYSAWKILFAFLMGAILMGILAYVLHVTGALDEMTGGAIPNIRYDGGGGSWSF